MKAFPKGSRVIVTGKGIIPGTVTSDTMRGKRLVGLDNGKLYIFRTRELAAPGSDKSVVISVRGGCVQDVEGLPKGWTYTLVDHDNIEAEEEA